MHPFHKHQNEYNCNLVFVIKIVSSAQTKELDQYTIEHEPIASIDLMERACRAFVKWFVERYDVSHPVGIVCGTGNNGGDGLGIARMLHDFNYPVKVWIVRGTATETSDFKTNLMRIENEIPVSEITAQVSPDLFLDCPIIIDAIFGSGLTRPVEGIYADVINGLNQTNAIKISVDIPSGMFADKHSEGIVFNADHTISFQFPKLAFVMSENNQRTGEWHLVDIGLSKKKSKEIITPYFLTSLKAVRGILKPRGKFDHKGKFGHALLIAGSTGKMGACVLAARAAMRSGVGLLTVHIPKSGYVIVQSAVPEAMALIDSSTDHFSDDVEEEKFSVVGIGPGLGQHTDTHKALEKLLKKSKKPMVIDADALNIISTHPSLQSLIPEGSILTPHPKEFERLAGTWPDDFERLELLKKFSTKINSVIVLKGAYSAIACPSGNVYFNPTGNPGMATAGSGDVLTGILTGLLAQGYAAEDAACLGVFVHGLSGDIAAKDNGMNALLASDLIAFLPAAFKKLE
jgi:ADP-dependent NAD(P)H-hydrate dehydratase / NAD(P)H-hydrate epimerase